MRLNPSESETLNPNGFSNPNESEVEIIRIENSILIILTFGLRT